MRSDEGHPDPRPCGRASLEAKRQASRLAASRRQFIFMFYVAAATLATYIGPQFVITSSHLTNPVEYDVVREPKVLLYLTTHMSEQHIWFLQHCWPLALQHSALLRSSDVMVFATPENTPQEKNETITILENTFPNQNLSIQMHAPLEKQHGAMAALSEAARSRWFTGYDWVIRLNPDVILRNDTWIRSTMSTEPKATALLIHCKKNQTKPISKINTDFFMVKPEHLSRRLLLHPSDPENAERSFAASIRKSILNPRTHRLIPGVHSPDSTCRAGHNRIWTETDILHIHPSEDELKANVCPIPFDKSPAGRPRYGKHETPSCQKEDSKVNEVLEPTQQHKILEEDVISAPNSTGAPGLAPGEMSTGSGGLASPDSSSGTEASSLCTK